MDPRSHVFAFGTNRRVMGRLRREGRRVVVGDAFFQLKNEITRLRISDDDSTTDDAEDRTPPVAVISETIEHRQSMSEPTL